MTIAVEVPSLVLEDPELPELKLALNPVIARKELKRRLPRLSGEGKLRLKGIRVTKHKPGRRCVVEYDVRIEGQGTRSKPMTLIGKVRARRSGNEGFRIQEAIWNSGFTADSPDGISVPEPLGVIPRFRMWFQRKVSGSTLDRLLTVPDAASLGSKIADAARKLHQAGVSASKAHTLEDELIILAECFRSVAAMQPEWSDRLERLLEAARKRAAQTPPSGRCGIHRDYYASQLVVDGERLWVLDFDLYCVGDPALDIGNFLGHVTEQSLRELGRAGALVSLETAVRERFISLADNPASTRAAIALYADLTLARHVYLSLKIPGREQFSPKLLRLCERRFGTL